MRSEPGILELWASSHVMVNKYPEEVVLAMAWHDFTQEVLERAAAIHDREAAVVELDPVTQAPTASSHVVEGALQRYMQWFCAAANRRVEQGPPGHDAEQPEVPQSDGYDDAAWARFFLQMGGYGSAMQVDTDGWSALMHAVQATVYWSQAWRCCRGLIGMMPDAGLRAKATGGG